MAKVRAGLTLRSHTVGALTLVNHVRERLRFADILARHLPPPEPRAPVPPLTALGVLTRNLVLARVPLYGLGEWARGWVPSLLGLTSAQAGLLHDDRVGRALDRLFDAHRRSLLTERDLHMVKKFRGALTPIHNNSSTLPQPH